MLASKSHHHIILLFCLVAMTSLEFTRSLIPPSSGISRIPQQNTMRYGNFARDEGTPLSLSDEENVDTVADADRRRGTTNSRVIPFLRFGGAGAGAGAGASGVRFDILRHMRMRHGASSSPADRQKIIMTVALFSTYFSVMGAKCALPSTFNLITSTQSGLNFHNHDPNQFISKVLTISTGAISFGKFVLGPVIDKYGGVACLKVALSMLMGCLLMIGSTNSFGVFALSWIMVDFIFSSCWAACLSAIHHTFPEEEWASNIGLLAVAGRVGNAASFFTFASVLQLVQQRQAALNNGGNDFSWRVVFWLSSLIQLIPLFALTCYQRAVMGSLPDDDESSLGFSSEESRNDTKRRNRNIVPASPPSSTRTIKDSLIVLRGEAKNLSFWMHLISRSSLMIIASFLLFVPSYMTNAFGMTSAAAARVGSLYALGSLLSVSFGAKRFSAMTMKNKIISTIVLLGSLLGCSLMQLAHIKGVLTMTSFGGALSMFIWGVTFSIPFYIPPSMYALRRGGSESSATIADAFDFFGFFMLAWFNGFVAGLKQDVLMSWLAPFWILSGFSAISLICLVAAIITEV